MNEEKSMVEYKETKGLFGWLKSKLEKLKDRFRPKTEMIKQADEGPRLTAEQLDVVEGGFPDRSILDYDELEGKINNIKEPKSWNLTDEEQEIVEEGYQEIRTTFGQAEQEEQQLFEEDLDKITAGHPIIEEDEHSK